MLLMVQKRIRGGICHAIHQYVNAKTIKWKIMITIKNCHIISIAMGIVYIDGLYHESCSKYPKVGWKHMPIYEKL